MGSFGKYLRKRREARGMTLEELANKAGVSFSLLSKIETGSRGAPKIERMERLAQALGVDISEMLAQAQQDKNESATETPRENGQTSTSLDNFYHIERADIIGVPVVRDIKPGQPWWHDEFQVGFDFFLKNDIHNDRCLHFEVTDDHMQGDGIVPGYLVLVRVSSDVPHGKIALVSIKGERRATLRRLYYAMELDSIILQASNPRIEPRVVPISEIGKTVDIIGEALRATIIL